MNDPLQNPQLAELLIDRATVGLTDDEHSELQRLLDSAAIADDFSFEAIVALLQESSEPVNMKPLPDHIRSRVLIDAERVVSSSDQEINAGDGTDVDVDNRLLHRLGSEQQSEKTFGQQRWSRREMFAWLAAAASLLVAGFLWLGSDDINTTGLISRSDQGRWDKFVAAADPENLFEVQLATGNHESGSQAKGTVLWNQQSKRGVIKLSGLATNDPDQQQYQLWVIDRVRGIEDRPNAGVFDITQTGENIFEFRSDLKVFDPQGFAVTVEKPGGVNKSDLSKIALVNLGPS